MALDLQTYAAPLLVSGTSGALLSLGARVEYAPDLRGDAAKRRYGRADPNARAPSEATGGTASDADGSSGKASLPQRGGSSGSLSKSKAAAPNVTIKDLVDAGLVQPGASAVTVTYKNNTYVGDLLPDGTIVYEGTKFASASAFSVHVKRLQTPGKQGDDGWRSVHASASGRSLHDLRLQLLQGPGAAAAAGAAAAGGGGGGGGGRGRGGRPRGRPSYRDQEEEYDEEEEDEEEQQPAAPEPAEVHWVQCSKCERWRVVPDSHWGAIASADEDADWFCQDARWDLKAFEPFEPACQ